VASCALLSYFVRFVSNNSFWNDKNVDIMLTTRHMQSLHFVDQNGGTTRKQSLNGTAKQTFSLLAFSVSFL